MNDPYQLVFIIFAGLCLGSFASLLAYRWPRRLPWTAARSKCPSCGHALGVCDLMPVLSWAASGGKCRYCDARISIRYPLLEILSAALCLLLYGLIGWHWMLAAAITVVPFALALAVMRFFPVRD